MIGTSNLHGFLFARAQEVIGHSLSGKPEGQSNYENLNNGFKPLLNGLSDSPIEWPNMCHNLYLNICTVVWKCILSQE